MKFLKKFNENNNLIHREINNCGFMDGDLLSTLLINGNKGKLYVFNWGNYGKVRNYLNSVILFFDDDDVTSISDWLCDLLRDYDISADVSVIDRKMINKKDILDTDFLSKYPDNEIGEDVLLINLNINI